MKQGKTYNPIRRPMASRKPQAFCLTLSSWLMDIFPLCFSDRYSTSAGVKYGWWNLDEEAGCWPGDEAAVFVVAMRERVNKACICIPHSMTSVKSLFSKGISAFKAGTYQDALQLFTEVRYSAAAWSSTKLNQVPYRLWVKTRSNNRNSCSCIIRYTIRVQLLMKN
jgi:hypothetical protein